MSDEARGESAAEITIVEMRPPPLALSSAGKAKEYILKTRLELARFRTVAESTNSTPTATSRRTPVGPPTT